MLQPGDRLVADANTGWLMHDALRVVRAVRDVDVYIEQPCLTYEECLSVRRHTDHPFVLDEVIDSIDVLLRGQADLAMDVVNLKISKLGGLTKTQQARDLCVSLGIAMTLEDSWGGDIVTAAIAHLAHSTPPEFLFTATDFNSYVTVSIAEGAPQRVNGRMAASHAPGLGIQPRPSYSREARRRRVLVAEAVFRLPPARLVYQGISRPRSLKKLPESFGVRRSMTLRTARTLSSGESGAYCPPMRVRTQPGEIRAKVISSFPSSAESVRKTWWRAALETR